MTRLWRLSVLLGLALMSLWLVGSGPASRFKCTPHWRTVPSPRVVAGIEAFGIASPTDIWAVGNAGPPGSGRGFIERWNGQTWRVVPSPAGEELRDVAVIAPHDVWAVGLGDNPALAEHWDGKRWTWVPPPGTDVSLWAVDGDATNDVWTVGTSDSGLVIFRWDGFDWRRMPAPSAPASVTNGPLTTFSGLTGIAVLAKNDVWVAGSKATGGFRGDALTAHWDGRRWRFVVVPAAVGDLGTFAVVSPRDIWAVTGQRGRGDVIHWDGVRWRISPHPEMDGPVSDVGAVSRDDVWVVNPVMHWNGRKWSVARRAGGFEWYLAVAAVSHQDVWVTREASGRDFADKPVFEHYSCKQP